MNTKMVMYKIYGREGHRQASSFQKSEAFTDCTNTICLLLNSDILHNDNKFSILLVFGNSVKGCNNAFEGQLCDGIWENLTVGKIEFSTDFGNTWKEWYLIEDIIKNEN